MLIYAKLCAKIKQVRNWANKCTAILTSKVKWHFNIPINFIEDTGTLVSLCKKKKEKKKKKKKEIKDRRKSV